ncbi:MAG: hypothetical protein ACKOWF_00580 [Chloroflexota bacterium]
MNVTDGLERIRERLQDDGASAKTIGLVDAILARSRTPSAANATARSMSELVKMLQRTPLATNDITVYNELLRLEENLAASAQAYRDRLESEERQAQAFAESRSKAFYKAQKEKKKAGG